jgi:hypothetical protein
LWIVSIGALLFVSAGTLDWPNAWVFMAEFVIGGPVRHPKSAL